MWAGVDVGGRRKGFHCAVLSGDHVLSLACIATPTEVANHLALHAPGLVAIDSPTSLACDGERSRRCERDFVAAAICKVHKGTVELLQRHLKAFAVRFDEVVARHMTTILGRHKAVAVNSDLI